MSRRLTPQFKSSRRLTPQYDTQSHQTINANAGFQTITANLNHLKNLKERDAERSKIQSGHYYILEIVRPDTREARRLWGLDGTRNINGVSRVVSRQKMYVANVWKSGNEIRLECRGMDNSALRKNLCKFINCDKDVSWEWHKICHSNFLQYTMDTVICQDTLAISQACRDT